MLIPRLAVWMFAVGLMVLDAGVVSGQNYPDKPVRIVSAEVGGGTDFVARLIAQGLTGSLGKQVIVDNRPSGVIPGQTASKASPDGYTLLISGSILWIGPLIQNAPYAPMSNFSPITLVGSSPNILVVHPSLPVKSVTELVAFAKARPGELNYASPGAGGSSHLAAELFKAMAGVNILRIPYRSTGMGLTALIAGQVELMFPATGGATPHIKSGRLRALAVTSAKPSALAPGLPTMAASGLPGYESVAPYGMFAPAGTPAAIISRLNQEIVRVLSRPDSKERLFNAGIEVVGSSPEQLAAAVKSDTTRMSKVIKDAGIREE